jgi:trypsin
MKLLFTPLLLLRSMDATTARSDEKTVEVEPSIGEKARNKSTNFNFADVVNFPRPMLRGFAEASKPSTAAGADLSRQIINGEATGAGPVDYMVGLGFGEDPDNVWCGGTLINPRVVLTAAHCMGILYLDRVFVNLYDSTDVEVIDFGSNFVVHPDYNSATDENDVALILLPYDVKNADTIQYPKLNEKIDEPEDGDSLLVMGGFASEGGSISDVLLQAGVNYVTNEQCSSDYAEFGWGITDGMICAAGDGEGVCYGHSGGPLMLDNADSDLQTNPVLVGIKSWSIQTCDAGYPDVYTRVSYYADWIKEQTACALDGGFCPCSGSDKYLKVIIMNLSPTPETLSWDVTNTCGDYPNPMPIMSGGGLKLEVKVMCVPEQGQYVFNLQVREQDLSSMFYVFCISLLSSQNRCYCTTDCLGLGCAHTIITGLITRSI